jgi:Protein of unknown function (DUF3237)
LGWLSNLCHCVERPYRPLKRSISAQTSAGHRYLVSLEEVRWEGERLRARRRTDAAAADWLVVGPDGTGFIDIRFTLETDDGASIYVHYEGRRDFTKVEQGIDAPVYITPVFETSDERYSWLNKIQAVGKGTLVDDTTRVYDIYELR